MTTPSGSPSATSPAWLSFRCCADWRSALDSEANSRGNEVCWLPAHAKMHAITWAFDRDIDSLLLHRFDPSFQWWGNNNSQSVTMVSNNGKGLGGSCRQLDIGDCERWRWRVSESLRVRVRVRSDRLTDWLTGRLCRADWRLCWLTWLIVLIDGCAYWRLCWLTALLIDVRMCWLTALLIDGCADWRLCWISRQVCFSCA